MRSLDAEACSTRSGISQMISLGGVSLNVGLLRKLSKLVENPPPSRAKLATRVRKAKSRKGTKPDVRENDVPTRAIFGKSASPNKSLSSLLAA